MKVQLGRHKIVDYIFWILFILFTDPGGILKSLGENSADGGINITDLLFVFISACYLYVFQKSDFIYDKNYSKLTTYFSVFLIYYIVVFCFFVPLFKSNPFFSPVKTLIKIRYGVLNILLIPMIYRFYIRSNVVFFNVFFYSSIVILIMFIITVTTGSEILPVKVMNRRFIQTKRLIMINYGVMPILIPMAVVLLVFKFKVKYRKIIVIGAVLMFVVWFFSLIRRNIFGTFLYMIPSLFLYNYLRKKSFLPVKKILNIVGYFILLLLIIQITMPKYIEFGLASIEESIHIIKYGKSMTGTDDNRLGLGTEFIQNKIIDNPIFGTGFDNRWRTKAGDDAGYEASDYPFLGALAMTGVVGLLFFLPIYILLLRIMVYDIKYLRSIKIDYSSYEVYIVVFFIVYFIYDFLQYMNWFLPISVIEDKKWYVCLVMYMASRRLMYEKFNGLKPTLN